jgi:2-polyprenyl-3-methyl-5-hydroxy-6-metoxy-1,4-benzoquinol methylase
MVLDDFAVSHMDKDTVNRIAEHYKSSDDFDAVNTTLASRIICPYCENRSVLEVGCALGEMTKDLVDVAASVTVVEPTSRFSDGVQRRFGSRIRVLSGFMEDIEEPVRYDVIVVASLLHHLESPSAFLGAARRLLNERGVLLATVPNMTSLHRRLGVKAGALRDVSDATETNVTFQQPGRFVKASLEDLFRRSGYEILESYGYMLKPFANDQMSKLELGWPIIDALFEIGKEHPDLASHLFIRARP